MYIMIAITCFLLLLGALVWLIKYIRSRYLLDAGVSLDEQMVQMQRQIGGDEAAVELLGSESDSRR